MHSTGPAIQAWSKRKAGKLLAITSLGLCLQSLFQENSSYRNLALTGKPAKLISDTNSPATLVTHMLKPQNRQHHCVFHKYKDTDSNPLKCSQQELLMGGDGGTDRNQQKTKQTKYQNNKTTTNKTKKHPNNKTTNQKAQKQNLFASTHHQKFLSLRG